MKKYSSIEVEITYFIDNDIVAASNPDLEAENPFVDEDFGN